MSFKGLEVYKAVARLSAMIGTTPIEKIEKAKEKIDEIQKNLDEKNRELRELEKMLGIEPEPMERKCE